jgi:hypothetical protein
MPSQSGRSIINRMMLYIKGIFLIGSGKSFRKNIRDRQIPMTCAVRHVDIEDA